MTFLRQKSVGLYLTDETLRLATLYKKGHQITPGLFETILLPPGLILDGQICDYQELIKILKSFKKKINFNQISFAFSNPEIDLWREVKTKIIWFGNEAEAAARAFLSPTDRDTYMLLQIEASQTIISIVTEAQVCFCQKLKIPAQFLENLMNQSFGLDFFCDEINKHYLAWHLDSKKSKEKPIKKVFLYGSAPNLEYLREYLSSNLRLPVFLANVWTNIIPSFDQKIPDLSFKESLGYATAIGLALKGFEF